MKEKSMVDGKQNYHLYADRDGMRLCSLYQGASGLPDIKPFLILWEIYSQCSGSGRQLQAPLWRETPGLCDINIIEKQSTCPLNGRVILFSWEKDTALPF